MTSHPPIILDLTRSVSGADRGPGTGIDRVERAWLTGLLDRDAALFGLVRTSAGYCWLDRAGLAGLVARLEGRVPWGDADTLARLSRRLSPARRRADSDVRRLAAARAFRGGLAGLVDARFPPGSVYVNLGHSHLETAGLAAMAARARVAVMLHDTIPLELPDTQRPGTTERFRARLEAVRASASCVLVPSRTAGQAVSRHLPEAEIFVLPLGVSLADPDSAGLPKGVPGDGPYLVSLGTIDPRKNQSLLLDIWRDGGPGLPPLYLVGRVGWADPRLERALAHLPPGVRLLSGLGDAAVAALVKGATALLHPSFAEGYGLPVMEAALRGVPVIASDLPVFHEILGDYPVYADPSDRYQWECAIRARLKQGAPAHAERERAAARLNRPTWDTHLNLALTRLWQ